MVRKTCVCLVLLECCVRVRSVGVSVCLLVMLAKGEEGTGASYRSLAQDSSPASLALRRGYLFLFLRKVLPDTHVCSS